METRRVLAACVGCFLVVLSFVPIGSCVLTKDLHVNQQLGLGGAGGFLMFVAFLCLGSAFDGPTQTEPQSRTRDKAVPAASRRTRSKASTRGVKSEPRRTESDASAGYLPLQLEPLPANPLATFDLTSESPPSHDHTPASHDCGSGPADYSSSYDSGSSFDAGGSVDIGGGGCE